MTPHAGRGERRFRALLRLFPQIDRDESEEELVAAFRWLRDRWLLDRKRLGPGFWLFVTGDVVRSARRERRDPLDRRGRPRVGSEGGGDGMLRAWTHDLRHAARRLGRSPGFAFVAVSILTLGIGVNATAFSIVNALLIQPPPFAQPDRLVLVLQDDDGGSPSSTSYPAYQDMTRSTAFSAVSAFNSDQAFLEQEGVLAPILVEYATASYMEVIGLSPTRGRWFGPEHDDPTGPPVAVITHAMWADRMASDPSAVGSTLRINGGAVTVVGVGPPEFNGGRGPGAVDLWLSVSAMRATGGRAFSLTRREDHPFQVRARLADGVSVEQARTAMNVLADDLARTYPELNAERGISVLPVTDTRVSPEVDAGLRAASAFAMVIVALVLVIGTLNLANLLLVRSTARSRELAVRLALGAGRTGVVRVVLAEAVLLAAIGGAGGLGVAAVFARIARNSRLDFTIPLLLDLRLDARVVLFTFTLSAAAGILFGLLPALRATRRDVNQTLRDDATFGLRGRGGMGLTGALVGGQVAVSLLLLAAAGAFVESLLRARGTNPGFDAERTAYVQINAASTGLEGEALVLLLEQIEERLEALQGVEAAATALALPGAQFGTTTLLLGAEPSGADRPTEIPWNYVTPDYFDVMGLPLVDGRLLEDLDAETGAAVVSASFGRTYFGRTDIAGSTFRREGSPDSPLEIVGVVPDATVRSLGEPPTASLYWPLDFAYPRVNFVVRTTGDPADALGALGDAVRQVDARILLLDLGTMAGHLGDTLRQERMASLVLAGLGGLALVLAMLGLYGVVSFAVSRRRREVGIRIALGAGSGGVVRLFFRDVAVVVAVGSLLGLALSVPLGRAAASFTGGAASPLMVGAVALLLLATSLAATLLPALRATRTDPTEALRQE